MLENGMHMIAKATALLTSAIPNFTYSSISVILVLLLHQQMLNIFTN